MTNPPHETSEGFTLVEVLVSMVVVAFALMGLSATILTARQMEERARTIAMNVEDAETASVLMDALLRRAIAGEGRFPGIWTMNERRMAFLSVPPAGVGQFGLARFDLHVKQDAEGRSTMVATWLHPGAAEPMVEPVIAGAAAIRFSYLGSDPSSGAVAWQERWTAGSFPLAVRLTIERVDTDDAVELVFRSSSGPADPCVVDPSLAICGDRS